MNVDLFKGKYLRIIKYTITAYLVYAIISSLYIMYYYFTVHCRAFQFYVDNLFLWFTYIVVILIVSSYYILNKRRKLYHYMYTILGITIIAQLSMLVSLIFYPSFNKSEINKLFFIVLGLIPIIFVVSFLYYLISKYRNEKEPGFPYYILGAFIDIVILTTFIILHSLPILRMKAGEYPIYFIIGYSVTTLLYIIIEMKLNTKDDWKKKLLRITIVSSTYIIVLLSIYNNLLNIEGADFLEVTKIVTIIVWLLTFVIVIMRHFYVFITSQEDFSKGNVNRQDIVFLLSVLFYLTTFIFVVYKYFSLIEFSCPE